MKMVWQTKVPNLIRFKEFCLRDNYMAKKQLFREITSVIFSSKFIIASCLTTFKICILILKIMIQSLSS